MTEPVQHTIQHALPIVSDGGVAGSVTSSASRGLDSVQAQKVVPGNIEASLGSSIAQSEHSTPQASCPELDTAGSRDEQADPFPAPTAAHLWPTGDLNTPISSMSDLPSPWSEPSEAGSATPTTEKMRAAEQEALSFARTRRFEWVATQEDGRLVDYVVTGRHGELQRCEDEAIGAPGAVQAFGVLIAFDQETDGRLVVQQVSEVSTKSSDRSRVDDRELNLVVTRIRARS